MFSLSHHHHHHHHHQFPGWKLSTPSRRTRRTYGLLPYYEATENEEEREITILFKALMFVGFFFFVLKYSGEEQIPLRDIPFLV